MKIYTRKGDGGETAIWGGRLLAKDDARIEAIGAVDECNAAIGMALAHGLPGQLRDILLPVQAKLLVVGTELMTPQRTGPAASLPRMTAQDVTALEDAIDALEADLPELRNFILPGGSLPAAALHIARAVCRRAERRVTTLRRSSEISPAVPGYLNRLADLLFTAARSASAAAGQADSVWAPRSR